MSAGRPFSDRIGIFDRRSKAGRKSRPGSFGPAAPSGTQKARMTDVGDSERKVAQGTEAAGGESAMIPASVPAFECSRDPSAAVPSDPLRAGGMTKGEGGRCRASRHTPSGPPRIGGKPGATQNEADPFRPGRKVPSATVGPAGSSGMHKTQMTAGEKERNGSATRPYNVSAERKFER
jgi:hypothetical protein